MQADYIGYVNTMLRYYLHCDPSGMTDEEWAVSLAQLADIRKRESGKQ